MNTTRLNKIFQILLVLLSFTQFNSQNVNLTIPSCKEDGTVSYSLFANLTDYLKDNNVDKRPIYKTPEELKDKKVGILTGFPIDESEYKDVIKYESTEDLIKALRNHSIDGIVTCESTKDYIVLHNYDLYQLPQKNGEVKYGPISQMNNEIQQSFEKFTSKISTQNILEKWSGINYDAQQVNKRLDGNNGSIKVTAYLGNSPYAFKDKNGEPTGSCLDIIYSFAREVGYQIEFKEANSYDDQINAIKEKRANMTCGYLSDSITNDDSLAPMNGVSTQDTYSIIRLSNSETSIETSDKVYYDNYEQLNGQKLGVMSDTFRTYTEEYFPDSEIVEFRNSFDLYKALFTGQIEGFLTDNPSAQNFRRDFPDKVSYFEKNFHDNLYAFAFSKNNVKLRNDMNSFFPYIDLEYLYYDEWLIRPDSLTVNKTLNESAPKIRVAMFPDTKPVCFEKNYEIKGYEIDILYQFARAKNYNIELITLSSARDRLDYIRQDKADITGGALNSTEGIEDIIYSDGTLWAETTLVIPKEKSKSDGKIGVLDPDHKAKENNTVYFPVKVGDKDTVCACDFPETYEYNSLALINCTIPDLKGVDPTKNGLEIGNSPDTLVINNVEYNPTNLLNANDLTGRNIISESDKTNSICPTDPNSLSIETTITTTIPSTITSTVPTTTIPSTTTSTVPTPTIPSTITIIVPTQIIPSIITTTTPTKTITPNNTEKKDYIYKYSSKKSFPVGAIIGIVIPLAVILVAIAILAFLRRRTDIPAPSYDQRLDKSEYKLDIQYPIQQVQDHRKKVDKIENISQQILQPERAQKLKNSPLGVVVNIP